LWTLGDSNS